MAGNLRWFERSPNTWDEIVARMTAACGDPVFAEYFGANEWNSGGSGIDTRDYTAVPGVVPTAVGGSTCLEITVSGTGFTRKALTQTDFSGGLQGFLLVKITDPDEKLNQISLRFQSTGTNPEIDGWAPGGGVGDRQTQGYFIIPFTTGRPSTSAGTDYSQITGLDVKWATGTIGVSTKPKIQCEAWIAWPIQSETTTVRCRIDDGTQNPTTGNETLAHVQALNAEGVPVTIGMITPPEGTGTAAGTPTLSPAQIRQILDAEITGRTGVSNAVVNHLTAETANSDNWGTPDGGSDRVTDNKLYFGHCYNALRTQGVSSDHARYLIVPQGGAYEDDDDIYADSPLMSGMSWTGEGWSTGNLQNDKAVMPRPLPHTCLSNAEFWDAADSPETFIKKLIGTSGSTVEDLGEVGEFSSGGSEGANFIVKSDGWLASIGKGNAATIDIIWHAYNHTTAKVALMAAYLGVLQSNDWIRTDNLTGLVHVAPSSGGMAIGLDDLMI